MASYGGELLLDSSSPWSGISSLSSFSIPLPFIFQEAKESIDEEDPRPTSSNGAYITSDVGRKARVMLCILVGTVGGLLWLGPRGHWSGGVGISLLLLCSSYSSPPIARTGGGDVIKFPPLQTHFDPFLERIPSPRSWRACNPLTSHSRTR